MLMIILLIQFAFPELILVSKFWPNIDFEVYFPRLNLQSCHKNALQMKWLAIKYRMKHKMKDLYFFCQNVNLMINSGIKLSVNLILGEIFERHWMNF